MRLRHALSRRIKVGFGPIETGEHDLAVRKWHIDPIVDGINGSRSRFVADIFFPDEDLSRFDIVVIVKHFAFVKLDVVRRLRAGGTRFVYDTADIRSVPAPDGQRDIYEDPGAFERHYKPFVWSMDALILASPLQRRDFDDVPILQFEIDRPVLNRRFRARYDHRGPIQLVWQGYRENMPPMFRLVPIVHRLREETGRDVRLVFDSDEPAHEDGPVHYTAWNIHRWDRVLSESDVAVVIKPLDDPFQQRKSPTKVVSYMAAGLPVVCTPSVADRGVIVHGETGFFAYEDHEWHACLGALVMDAALRERVGTAARRHVIERYAVPRLTAGYVDLFEELVLR